jgi:small multidrug resistance pump
VTTARGWLLLGLTIGAEVSATLLLKVSDGFGRLLPSLGALAGYLAAVVLLARVLTTVPASIAYTVWTGAGSALVVISSAVLFGETLTVSTLLGIALITAGVIVLNSTA